MKRILLIAAVVLTLGLSAATANTALADHGYSGVRHGSGYGGGAYCPPSHHHHAGYRPAYPAYGYRPVPVPVYGVPAYGVPAYGVPAYGVPAYGYQSGISIVGRNGAIRIGF